MSKLQPLVKEEFGATAIEYGLIDPTMAHIILR